MATYRTRITIEVDTAKVSPETACVLAACLRDHLAVLRTQYPQGLFRHIRAVKVPQPPQAKG